MKGVTAPHPVRPIRGKEDRMLNRRIVAVVGLFLSVQADVSPKREAQ